MPESLIPGGTIVVDHRNLFRKGHSLTGTVTTSNILDPQDLGYRLEYRRPYVYGESDPQRTALAMTAFNARRISGTARPKQPTVGQRWNCVVCISVAGRRHSLFDW